MFLSQKFYCDRIYFSWWLFFEVLHVFGFVHFAGVGCVSKVSKDRAVSMFRFDVCRTNQQLLKRAAKPYLLRLKTFLANPVTKIREDCLTNYYSSV